MAWLGSEQHKEVFCREFLDTHQPYQVATLRWPALDPVSRERLRSLPFWDEAVATERTDRRQGPGPDRAGDRSADPPRGRATGRGGEAALTAPRLSVAGLRYPACRHRSAGPACHSRDGYRVGLHAGRVRRVF